MKKILFPLVCGLFLFSCEEPFEPDLTWQQKLVGIAYAAPERQVRLHLGSSLVDDQSAVPLSEAQVSLRTPNNVIQFEFKESAGSALRNSDFVLKSYSPEVLEPLELVIEHEAFPTARAKTFIPEKCCEFSLSSSLESEVILNDKCTKEYKISFFLESLEGAKDKGFHILVSSRLRDLNLPPDGVEHNDSVLVQTIPSEDYTLISSVGLLDYSSGILVSGSDLQNEGGILNFHISVDHSSSSTELAGLGIEVRTLSDEYYAFHEQLSKLNANNLTQENIFQQPVIGYTNFDFGFGAFGGYNYCIKNVEL